VSSILLRLKYPDIFSGILFIVLQNGAVCK
jgi:hypothetical protein